MFCEKLATRLIVTRFHLYAANADRQFDLMDNWTQGQLDTRQFVTRGNLVSENVTSHTILHQRDPHVAVVLSPAARTRALEPKMGETNCVFNLSLLQHSLGRKTGLKRSEIGLFTATGRRIYYVETGKTGLLMRCRHPSSPQRSDF